ATLEGGTTLVQNETIVTGIGRVQAIEATRPWVRAHYRGGGLAVNVWSNGRYNREPDRSLSTGLPLIQNAQISLGEVQYSFTPLQDLFVVGGVSQRYVNIDTDGTLMTAARNDNMTGVFGQLEYTMGWSLKALVAARWDRSSLHESQFSPKAALVWTINSQHSLRATYNRAFQSPNYSELYLNVKHPLRAVIYLGNSKLRPETITGYEVGYNGVFGEVVYVTAEAYFNVLEEFVTDLGPGVNPDYLGPIYIPGDIFPSRQVWSYTNAGEVEETGIDVGVNIYLSDQLKLGMNASYFTFNVVSRHPNDVLLPNASEYKVNGGVTYIDPAGWEASASVKHVPSYPWAAGIYRGTIKSYSLLNLAGSYPVTPSMRA
ncbi:MAG: TonB-dependent receptor, partial [Bacteroidota bacterium]